MSLCVLLLILQSVQHLSALSVDSSIYQYPIKAAVRVTFELNSNLLYNLTAKCLMSPGISTNGVDQTSCGQTTRSNADCTTVCEPITYEPLKYGWRIFVLVTLSPFAKTEPNEKLDILSAAFLKRMPPEPIFNISANSNSSRANLSDTVITVYLASKFSSRGRLDALTFSLVPPGESCCIDNRKRPAITKSWSPSDSGPHTLRLGITNHTSGQLYKVCALVSSVGTASPCVETREVIQQAPLPPKIKHSTFHRNHTGLLLRLQVTNTSVKYDTIHLVCDPDEKRDIYPKPSCTLEKRNQSNNVYSVQAFPYGTVFLAQSWSVIGSMRSSENSTFLFHTDLPVLDNLKAEAEVAPPGIFGDKKPSVRFTWMRPVDIAYPYNIKVSCVDCLTGTVKYTEIKDNSSDLEFIFSGGLTHGRNFSFVVAMYRGIITKHSDIKIHIYSKRVRATVTFAEQGRDVPTYTIVTLCLLTCLILLVGLLSAYLYYRQTRRKRRRHRRGHNGRYKGRRVGAATGAGTLPVRPTTPSNVDNHSTNPYYNYSDPYYNYTDPYYSTGLTTYQQSLQTSTRKKAQVSGRGKGKGKSKGRGRSKSRSQYSRPRGGRASKNQGPNQYGELSTAPNDRAPNQYGVLVPAQQGVYSEIIKGNTPQGDQLYSSAAPTGKKHEIVKERRIGKVGK